MPPRPPARASCRGCSGQTSVEFAALLPLLAALVLGVWQVAVAGHAVWAAGAASRAASRAVAVGGSAERAAARVLPRGLAEAARIRTAADGAVRVAVPVRAVIGGARLATVSSSARFEDQSS